MSITIPSLANMHVQYWSEWDQLISAAAANSQTAYDAAIKSTSELYREHCETRQEYHYRTTTTSAVSARVDSPTTITHELVPAPMSARQATIAALSASSSSVSVSLSDSTATTITTTTTTTATTLSSTSIRAPRCLPPPICIAPIHNTIMHEDQEVSKESQIKEASPVVVVEPDNQMLIDAEESKVESPQPPASILLSTRFQDFILLDESNWRETGVAIVKAIETATKRPVVLKLMSKSFAQPGSTIRLNTCREIVIQKQIHHRHAMALIDVMESDLFLCLLMEFAEHKDLFYVLESRGALPAQMALRILIETAEVLHYCHQRGIYHRDIKPDNIFMNQNFQVLLGDWNLAHCMTPNSKTRTQTGTLIYMPPEMFQPAIPYDPAKAEAWSLGVVLYIMLYGYPPWEVRTRLVAPGQTERFVPNYDEQLDPALRVLLQRLLCKNAEERMSIEFLLQIDWIRDVIRGKTTLVSLS